MSRYPNIDKDDLASGQTVNIEVKLYKFSLDIGESWEEDGSG